MDKQGAIELKNINKFYEKNHVVQDLNFQIKPGEFLSLLGPSGCGKTTILRLIAGLEYLDGGEIRMDGKRIDTLAPYKRPLNTIFQNYALFPHMNVCENIAYGLKAQHMPHGQMKEKVDRVIEMVQLKGFENRQPMQMSGGQRQRVSIARAIVNEPPVLLLDEPLTALDLKLRKEMRFELRNLQKELGITFIYVTHDQEEALVMSDRIAIMNHGKIEQFGTPQEIYANPISQFVAEFIGETNTFEAIVKDTEKGGLRKLALEAGTVCAVGKNFQNGEMVHLSIRPDKLKWSKKEVPNFQLPGIVTDRIFSGSFVKTMVELADGKEVKITELAGTKLPEHGEIVYLYWDEADAVVMKAESQLIHSKIENVDLSPWSGTR